MSIIARMVMVTIFYKPYVSQIIGRFFICKLIYVINLAKL